MTSKLFIGSVDSAGRVDPRPVVVTFNADGTVAGLHHLTGHEPHSTVCVNALWNTVDSVTKLQDN